MERFNKDYLIIGNDRLSKSLRKLMPNLRCVGSRDIVNHKIDLQEINPSNLILTGQATRRYQNLLNIEEFNGKLMQEINRISERIENFIYMSTIDVFGSNACMPLTSASLTGQPLDNYTISKLNAEAIIKSWHHCQSMIVRLPGLYGFDLNEGSAISRMVSTALKDGRISIYDKNIERPFMSYSACANTIIELMKRLNYTTNNKLFTIGARRSITLEDASTQIKDFIEKKGYKKNIVIANGSSDSSGGRDRVIRTDWRNECSNIGLNTPEDPAEGIENSMHVYTNQYAKMIG